MKTPFLCVVYFSLVHPALGLYVQPEIEDIPLERLLKNISERAKENPDDATVQHQLARTHAMAYARKLGESDEVKSWKGWQGKDDVQPWFGYEPPHVPFNKVTKTKDKAKAKAAAEHLDEAVEAYKKTLKLTPKDTAVKLGLAWCEDQAGEKKAAIEGYRAVLKVAWEKENKSGGGLGNFVYVETAGYLQSLLDPKKDAAELKELEERKKHLLSLPRAVTPIVVPVTRERTALEDLVDLDARVRFDLDATGRQLEWPWITRDAAWLVHDPRKTGRITSAIQMFGSHTFLLFCSDGYEALALLDDDRNGALSGSELKGLALWHDADGDGISSPGEVRPVAQFGITSFSTRGRQHSSSGMPYSPVGATFKDGSTRPTYDLIFRSK